MKNLNKDNDQMLTESDSYVLTEELLKSEEPGYYKMTTNAARLNYIVELDKWFKIQYNLLKEGKPNDELHLDVKYVSAPVTVVDTYNR